MNILMLLAREERNRAGTTRLGMFPPLPSVAPIVPVKTLLSGVSRDNTGVALPGCTCTLFNVTIDTLGRTVYTQVDQTVSDPVTGAYSFSVGQAQNYRVTFDLAGAPIRAGLTLNSLIGDNFGS